MKKMYIEQQWDMHFSLFESEVKLLHMRSNQCEIYLN